jgi:hypothetical protein
MHSLFHSLLADGDLAFLRGRAGEVATRPIDFRHGQGTLLALVGHEMSAHECRISADAGPQRGRRVGHDLEEPARFIEPQMAVLETYLEF